MNLSRIILRFIPALTMMCITATAASAFTSPQWASIIALACLFPLVKVINDYNNPFRTEMEQLTNYWLEKSMETLPNKTKGLFIINSFLSIICGFLAAYLVGKYAFFNTPELDSVLATLTGFCVLKIMLLLTIHKIL